MWKETLFKNKHFGLLRILSQAICQIQERTWMFQSKTHVLVLIIKTNILLLLMSIFTQQLQHVGTTLDAMRKKKKNQTQNRLSKSELPILREDVT